MSKVLVIIQFGKNSSTETKKWLEDKFKSIGLSTTVSVNSKNQVLR
jgi:hypothetical protein